MFQNISPWRLEVFLLDVLQKMFSGIEKNNEKQKKQEKIV